MAGGNLSDHEEEDDDLDAARWVLAIDAGLEPGSEGEFHAWLAARPERAELIARQAALPDLARQAQMRAQLDSIAARAGQEALARRRANEQALKSRRRFLVGGAIAAGAAAFGVTALMARPPWQAEESVPETVYETAVGEVRAIELADMSRLWLDTQTRVSARMSVARRDVKLTAGRLYVEVAHAPERPFVVAGSHFEARAIGTAFEVTVFADRSGVAVTEGVVRLTARDGQAINLAAGQAVSISNSGEVTRTTTAVRSIAAWRERRMVLSDRRLDAALAELSRYFDRPLTVADEQLAARRISLSFSIADLDEEGAARIIAAAVGADLADRANAGILLSPAGGHGDTRP